MMFRKDSLERLSNPEQLDTLLTVVTPRAWLALLSLLFLAFVAVLWAIFGSIPIRVEGKGIVMNEKGELFTVQSKVRGHIDHIYVKAGDKIKKNDLIATLYDAEQELKLDKAEMQVVTLTRDFEKLSEEIEREGKAQKEAFERELEAKKFSIEELEKKVKSLEEDVGKKRGLVNEGIISYTILKDAEDKLGSARIELETARSSLATLRFNLTKGYRSEELLSKEQELFKATEERDLLRTRKPFYQVNSPSDGTVLELLASSGEFVEPGALLVWMEYAANEEAPYLIYGYFPVEMGKRISVGTRVQIEVSTIDSQEYGYIIGTVTDVSHYAVSKDSIAKTIHNKELVEYLSSGAKAVIQVLIHPEINPKTGSYQWSSGKNPSTQLSTGTVCTLHAIVSRIRPIYYVLPVEAFKLSKGE